MTQTIELEKMGLTSISTHELSKTNGGASILGAWGTIWKVIERAGAFIGALDSAERFMDGWNSVKCNCK